jgi:hypothetical protein
MTWRLTLRFHSANGIFGFPSSKLQFGKTKPFSSIIAALMTETTPDAPSRCPMLDLTEPMKSGCLGVRPSPKTVCKADASIGSPTVRNHSQYLDLQRVQIDVQSRGAFQKGATVSRTLKTVWVKNTNLSSLFHEPRCIPPLSDPILISRKLTSSMRLAHQHWAS